MIETQSINVSYDRDLILRNMTLTINENEFVALVGKSGSGKSTLLRVINGLLPPKSGDYLFENQNVYKLTSDQIKKRCTQKMGFLWQNYRLISNLTVEKNVLLPSYITNRNYDKDYFFQLMNILEIEQYLKKYPNKLSGGEQQRVALARALLLKPSVVLADEPTGALDSNTARNLIHLLLSIHKLNKTTIIVATHDSELASVGSHIIELMDGEIVNDEKK